jgi:outer membrane protein OmpA-like peptidoglycan-associated protein
MSRRWRALPWTAVACPALAAVLSACSPSEKPGGVTQQDSFSPAGAGGPGENAVKESAVPSSRKLYFGFDRVDLQPEHEQVIESVATAATQSGRMVRLEGYCESPCSPEQAEASAKRTHAVAAALERLGVRAACILSDARRADRAPSADEDTRAEARRVQVLIGERDGQCPEGGAGADSGR